MIWDGALVEGGVDQIDIEEEIRGHGVRQDPSSARSRRAAQTGSQTRMKFRDATPEGIQRRHARGGRCKPDLSQG
jgi:hypothetical protein